MQKSSIVALFLGSVSTVSLGFSDMPEGDFNTDEEFVQITSRAASQSGSGVRARWVELPDCMRFCNFLDPVYGKANVPAEDGQPAGLYIPLRDDLANAIIATCKGPEPAWGPAVCIDPAAGVAPAADVPYAATQIYDPVWKTETVIPDQEHQINTMGAASNEASLQVKGPKGDFYGHWNWAHQSKNAEWSADGAYGVNYTDMMPTETSVGSHPPEPPALVQLDFQEEKTWVELPACSGADGEIVLAANLENASQATC
jgi:hypothetical protein